MDNDCVTSEHVLYNINIFRTPGEADEVQIRLPDEGTVTSGDSMMVSISSGSVFKISDQRYIFQH